MVQFKNVFTGKEKLPFTRATTSQKCLRVSGKHKRSRKCGPYAPTSYVFRNARQFFIRRLFQRGCIPYAWEFLNKTIGLPKEKLHITIFRDDDEAFHIWEKVLGPGPIRSPVWVKRIISGAMGDTGPCGPCSEIHYDLAMEFGCGGLSAPGCDCDRFWNCGTLYSCNSIGMLRQNDTTASAVNRYWPGAGAPSRRVQGVGSNGNRICFCHIPHVEPTFRS